MIYIYCLIDPFTQEIRYIGKSIRPEQRLQNHCNDHSRCYRTNWIQSIISKGEKPILNILESLDDSDDWQSREKWWIAWGKEQGLSLTNSTDGGDGVVNLSEESKAKISATWKGRKHKASTLVKLSKASKGRIHSLECRKHMSELMKNRQFTQKHRKRLSKSIEKLSIKNVNEIRDLIQQGMSQYRIAYLYNIHQGTVSNIKRKLFYNEVKYKPSIYANGQLILIDLSFVTKQWLAQERRINTNEN